MICKYNVCYVKITLLLLTDYVTYVISMQAFYVVFTFGKLRKNVFPLQLPDYANTKKIITK